ncbi:amidohydrolase family protein [Infirmifilum sp. SLHALR2]|nr:MAG: hypothetical protein B7L53_02815 [Thermofilum sp. NZ13]
MGVIEIGELLDHGVVRRRVKIRYEGSEDFYFESAVSPGLADAHAHPQVVDVGERRMWRHSYEWLEGRRLRVDEAGLRRDKELSSMLAKATILRSLVDGVTLLALTGSLEGNVSALLTLPVSPRVVLLPTVMEAEGWSTPERVFAEYVRNLAKWDGFFNMGFFVHSLRKAGQSYLLASYKTASKLGVPFALHLSEGIDESETLVELLGDAPRNVIAVHCIEGAEKCKRMGLRVVHCPTSNLYLYGRTLRGLEFFDSLGSDWPLVTGTVLRTYRDAVAVHGPSVRLLEKATVGGYAVFGMRGSGDLVAFDRSLEKVIAGEAEARAVFIDGKLVMDEGTVVQMGLGKRDVERFKEEAVRLAFEKYGV